MNRKKKAEILLLVIGITLAGCHTAQKPDTASQSSTFSPGDVEPGSARQPVELTEQATLRDYLVYAALNNPGLEAAFNKFKAAAERAPQARALPDPRFTYRYFIEEVETRVGAQRQSFALAQTFPWFGKLKLRGYAAVEAADAERQRYQSQKLKLFYQVKDAYYEYYYLWRAIAIVEENKRLVEHIESVLRARYRAAGATQPDVIRVQVEFGKLEDQLRSLEDLREPVMARLNEALNRQPDAPLPWPKTIKNQEVSVTDMELLVWLEQTNPQVRALSFEVDRRKHEIELAKKEYFPDLTLGLDYIDTANSTGGRRPSDDGKDPIIGSVSMNLPIWRDRIAAGVREARHRHLAAIRQKTQTTNSLNTALKLAAYRFRDANRKISLYRDTLLPKAKESLEATDASFRTGKASFTDLIDAERILLEFALSYERALADKAQRLAELEMLTGKEISESGTEKNKPSIQTDEQRANVGQQNP